jgi:hypothetical protein
LSFQLDFPLKPLDAAAVGRRCSALFRLASRLRQVRPGSSPLLPLWPVAPSWVKFCVLAIGITPRLTSGSPTPSEVRFPFLCGSIDSPLPALVLSHLSLLLWLQVKEGSYWLPGETVINFVLPLLCPYSSLTKSCSKVYATEYNNIYFNVFLFPQHQCYQRVN